MPLKPKGGGLSKDGAGRSFVWKLRIWTCAFGNHVLIRSKMILQNIHKSLITCCRREDLQVIEANKNLHVETWIPQELHKVSFLKLEYTQ